MTAKEIAEEAKANIDKIEQPGFDWVGSLAHRIEEYGRQEINLRYSGEHSEREIKKE